MNATFKKFLLFICIGSFSIVYATERITLFDSTITVNKDASLTVHEKISVISEGKQIKRGIFRAIPIRYGATKIPISVIKVLRDKQETSFDIQQHSSHFYIYIRKHNIFLPPGRYTFEIIYKIERQIGFFKNYDELAWNVTGAFLFPIDAITAQIILPENVPTQDIRTTAYTGFKYEKGNDYTSNVSADNIITFKTTRPFEPRENITIVATWPKGYLTPPTQLQEFKYIFLDYLSFVLTLGALLILLLFFVIVKIVIRNKPKGIIIPQFEAPEDLLPGEINFILKKKYTFKAFTADIVNMAVLGMLKIEEVKKRWISNEYMLQRTKARHVPEVYNRAVNTLFRKTSNLHLTKTNGRYVDSARKKLAEDTKEATQKYINIHTHLMFMGGTLALLLFVATTIISIMLLHPSEINVINIILFALPIYLFFKYFRSYTTHGNQIINQIKGFKLFLDATEKERLAMISAPDRSPEEYEKFLPYAIALGVEKNWTKQFEPIFKKLVAAGKNITPHWYMGRYYSYHSFGSSLTSSLSHSLIRSSTTPGSSSSFGSGGFSGSGGGGGGGGGC
jgi:uncharacterized membrane protein YgcG